jgi:hypothetical protein
MFSLAARSLFSLAAGKGAGKGEDERVSKSRCFILRSCQRLQWLRPDKPNRVGQCQRMVLSETRGLRLHGVVRGGLECRGRLTPTNRGQGLTAERRLTLEPERQPNRRTSTGRSIPAIRFAPIRRSSGLWLQMLNVETFSFLPKDQNDTRQFARHRQARDLGIPPGCELAGVEFLQRLVCYR